MNTETKRIPEPLRANLTNAEFAQLVSEAVELRQQRDSLAAAARAVVWFDWSDNDDDAVMAIESLRAALATVQS